MAKNEYADWDSTSGNNTDIGGINIAENCAAANINNALREMMGQLATYQVVGRTETQTLTNKTLNSPTIDTPTVTTSLTINGGAGRNVKVETGNIGWGTGVDYLTWVNGTGLEGYESSTFAFRIGTGSGNTRIQSVYDTTTANAASVHVSTIGILSRSTSSGEFKDQRASIDPGLVLKLNPVSFRSLHEMDEGRRFAGFIAEEVESVFPEASVEEGKNYDVRAIVAALVATVQEQQRRLNALEEGK